MLGRVILLALLATACGPKAPELPWIEHDVGRQLGGSTHDVGAASGSAAPAPTVDISKLDLAHLDAAAIDELDEATARAVVDKLGDAAPAGRVALRAARLAWHRGDAALARSLVARATTAADGARIADAAHALATAIAEPPVSPRTIAVLLPLSGRFASIGNELELAIKLAPASGTTWLFLDTRGDPQTAAAAVDQAIAKGAAAILGPVGVRTALAAARVAAMRGIPIGLLAPADGADPASGVFRLVGSPGDEGRTVARLARDEGFPTVAVLSPRDDVGGDAAAAFVAEAEQLGLAVTAQGTYDPTGGNLQPDVKAFLQLDPTKNPALADHLARHGKKGWKTFTPDLSYSLLYIPDRYDRAALVAAFLPYYNVELRTTEFPDADRLRRKHGGVMPQVVQLVGGAGWHHPSLPLRGGAAVQGALVVDAFAFDAGGDVGGDAAAGFASAFQARTRRLPGTAAAEVYDAATLIARARQEVGNAPDVRAALRAALARVKLDDGACGPSAMTSGGELVRTSPQILEVEGDQFVVAM